MIFLWWCLFSCFGMKYSPYVSCSSLLRHFAVETKMKSACDYQSEMSSKDRLSRTDFDYCLFVCGRLLIVYMSIGLFDIINILTICIPFILDQSTDTQILNSLHAEFVSFSFFFFFFLKIEISFNQSFIPIKVLVSLHSCGLYVMCTDRSK